MVQGVTIGRYGCLIVSIANAVTSDNPKYGEYMTPDMVNMIIQNNNGYTEKGLVIWSVIEKFFFFKHKNIGQLKPDFSDDKQYIVHMPFENTGHFCNLINLQGEEYIYFDVWDGKQKKIKRSDIISCRALKFKKNVK